MRVFLGAVRSYAALNDLDNAGKVGAMLVDSGPDIVPVNNALVEFAKLVQLEYKKAEALATDPPDPNDAEAVAKIQDKFKALQTMFGELLTKLAAREQHSLGGLVYLADTCASIGMTAEAKTQYEQILTRAQDDPAFAAQAEKAMVRVRAQLSELLSKEGKYQEAFEQVEELVKATKSRALEPLMGKGRILQGWASQEPAKYQDAVKHWAWLRNLLGAMPKKLPEYYEVTYNSAYCLTQAAKNAKDTEAATLAKQAEQLLKSTLVLSPQLTGPDMVARYNALLDEVGALLGRKPAEEQKP